MKTTNHQTGDIRLTSREMRKRDFRRLSTSLSGILPEFDARNEFERALTGFVWCEGFKKLNGDVSEEGQKLLRQIWRGLADGPFHASPFRLERSGRWGIVFVVTAEYAAERARRCRRRHNPGALDAAFEKDFRRRSKVHAEARCQ